MREERSNAVKLYRSNAEKFWTESHKNAAKIKFKWVIIINRWCVYRNFPIFSLSFLMNSIATLPYAFFLLILPIVVVVVNFHFTFCSSSSKFGTSRFIIRFSRYYFLFFSTDFAKYILFALRFGRNLCMNI